MPLYAVDAPHLFARDGNPYVGPTGREWTDNPFRFAALATVAADFGRGRVPPASPTSSTRTTGRLGSPRRTCTSAGGRAPAW